MKKVLFTIAILFLSMITTEAYASTSISIKSSSSVTVGNNLSVTVTISSSEALGSWDFVLGYDTSKLTLLDNTNQKVVGYGDGTIKSKSYTFNFKTKAVGSASIYIDSASYYNWDEKSESVTKGSKKVNIVAKQTNNPTSYSSNNYLSSLSIEGYELIPEFNKNTLEYSAILPVSTYDIKIVGSPEDKKAKVTGLGDVKLTDGENKLEIKVTAENGNVKTYVIKATVTELSPITISIDDSEYTVVRKKENLEIPNNYRETTTTINGENVLAFYGEVTNYTLVALKDNNGDIFWYIYNMDENSYTLYKEFNFNNVNIYPYNINDEISLTGYEKDSMIINDEEIQVLKNGNSYPVIYGKNLDTGEVGYYTYDAKENTLQRYNEDESSNLKNESKKYFYCVIVLGILSVIELIVIIIIIVYKNGKNNEKLEKALSKTIKLNPDDINNIKQL